MEGFWSPVISTARKARKRREPGWMETYSTSLLVSVETLEREEEIHTAMKAAADKKLLVYHLRMDALHIAPRHSHWDHARVHGICGE